MLYGSPGFIQDAAEFALRTPLDEVGELFELYRRRAAAMSARLEDLEVPAKFGSDLAVAKALIAAAKTGALENIRINLESIHDERFRADVEARLAQT